MGWRPGMPPIGYYNRAMAGVKDIVVDPDRGHIAIEMFERVARNGDSGRTLKKWLDTCLTTRDGKKVTLSQIYLMLKNPFYYGEFEYPIGSGNWYKGSHTPLITKELFDPVQKQLIVPKKAKWGSKILPLKNYSNARVVDRWLWVRIGTGNESMVNRDIISIIIARDKRSMAALNRT